MSHYDAAEVAYMERVFRVGLDLSRCGSVHDIGMDNRVFLRHLLTSGWNIRSERPYRWEMKSPLGDVMVFDEKHNALNISGSRERS